MDKVIKKLKQIAKERYGCEITKTHDALATEFKELFGFDDEDLERIKEENISVPSNATCAIEKDLNMNNIMRFNLDEYTPVYDYDNKELLIKKNEKIDVGDYVKIYDPDGIYNTYADWFEPEDLALACKYAYGSDILNTNALYKVLKVKPHEFDGNMVCAIEPLGFGTICGIFLMAENALEKVLKEDYE